MSSSEFTRVEPGPVSAGRLFELTDLGNAERLAHRHGADLRYCHPWHSWLVWDGRRWARDDTAEAMRRAHETARSIHLEAANEEDSGRQRKLGAWAMTSQSGGRLGSMLTQGAAMAGIPVRPEEMDRNPWLLNLANGTLNLRTGELGEHRRADLITRLAPVEFNPEARATLWEACLERWLPDSDIRDLVQRFCGAALTGAPASTSHLGFLCGVGANGKSVFGRTLLGLMGDYGIHAAPEILLTKREGGVPCDLAELAGRRLALTVEVEEGRRLAEVVVKTLTGGDRQKARFMRENFFEFDPTATIMLAANHKPEVRTGGDALWRRIVVIPFDVVIPEAERQPHLVELLTLEREGILRWALEGCRAWLRDGLAPPEVVMAATASYRMEEDALGTWLADCCEVGPQRWARAAELWESWREWAHKAGLPYGTQTSFGRSLGGPPHAFASDRLPGGARIRHGLNLRSEEEG